ncbi:MAG TPA: hypothetical protein VFM18_02890 [Methanosarcina sp.]|nr:hypothetical protein [Methanosarcina sp.]
MLKRRVIKTVDIDGDSLYDLQKKFVFWFTLKRTYNKSIMDMFLNPPPKEILLPKEEIK